MTISGHRVVETTQNIKRKTTAYSISDSQKTSKACVRNVRTSFKNTRETANAVKGMTLQRAKSYLRHVLAHIECVPFVRYKSGVGRTAQAKNFKFSHNALGRWPRKSALHILELLKNAEANAVASGKKINRLYISHISVNKAPIIHRRIYRAHGRVSPFNSHPSHIELVLREMERPVRTPKNKTT